MEGGPSGIVGSGDDLPPSWVPKLHIPRDKLDMRCPKVRHLCALASRPLDAPAQRLPDERRYAKCRPG